jgi:hypothetical protein
MQKSTKYLQVKPSNVEKELYTMTKLDLFQIHKVDSTLKNQLVQPITSTGEKRKII